jgi:hypothetical protein
MSGTLRRPSLEASSRAVCSRSTRAEALAKLISGTGTAKESCSSHVSFCYNTLAIARLVNQEDRAGVSQRRGEDWV